MDFESYRKDRLLEHILQDGLFARKLLLILKEVRFSEQEFPTSKLILNIKYHYLGFWNNNLFYLFNDQLDYTLANHFAKFKVMKDNVNRFLSNLLMFLLIEKLFY